MNKLNILGLGLVLAMSSTANAAIITLQSATPIGGDTRFTYQGTLGPDEGVKTGDILVIYDFAGYVEGSIFAVGPNITTSTEFTSMGLISPGQTDDVSLVNLVFTYTGPEFRTADGPFAPFNFEGFGAVSTFAGITLDAFKTLTTKNNPENAEGSTVTTLGVTSVPGVVPEPASWMMMIGGFGLVGFSARRRRVTAVAA